MAYNDKENNDVAVAMDDDDENVFICVVRICKDTILFPKANSYKSANLLSTLKPFHHLHVVFLRSFLSVFFFLVFCKDFFIFQFTCKNVGKEMLKTISLGNKLLPQLLPFFSSLGQNLIKKQRKLYQKKFYFLPLLWLNITGGNS